MGLLRFRDRNDIRNGISQKQGQQTKFIHSMVIVIFVIILVIKQLIVELYQGAKSVLLLKTLLSP